MEGWLLLPLRLIAVGLVTVCVSHSMTATEPLVALSPEPSELAHEALEASAAQPPAHNSFAMIIFGLAIVVGLLTWQQRAMARRLKVIADTVHRLGGAYMTTRSNEQVNWSTVVYELLFGMCDRIIKVDLSDTNVTDDDLGFLVELTSLTSLNLARTAITVDFTEQIARLRRLRQLSLAGTPITDAACANLAKLARLRRLDLSYTNVSDSGLQQLASLRHLSILEIGSTPAKKSLRSRA